MQRYKFTRQSAGKVWSRLMNDFILRFIKNDSAATAIEYALIASGLSIVILGAVNSIGTSLNTTFAGVATQLK